MVVFMAVLCLSSCGDAPQVEEHQHRFSDKLEYDRKGHFYPAICEHKDLRDGYEEHQYNDWETIKEATEKEEGTQERKCHVCGYVETESIPCKTHTHAYGKWEVKSEPTLTEEGRLERICQTDSTHIETFSLPRLNQSAYTYEVEKEPTCEENGTGIGKYVYQKDGESFSFSVMLDKLAHTYGDWTIVSEPTLENEGSLKRVCDRDASHVDLFELPILNSRDYSYSTIKSPTCYEDGLDRYTISKDGKSFSFDVKRISTGHTYKETYSFDSSKHWLEPSCEHQDQLKEIQSHTLENGVCKVCGYDQNKVTSEGVTYTLNEDQTAYIASLDTSYQQDSIVIKSQYEGIPVTTIHAEGFKDSTAKYITIPGNITEMGMDAFKGCQNLWAIFYEGSITDWCHLQFENEFATPMYYATSFYMLNENTWKEVTDITIPEAVTIINDYQFYGFTNLTNIKLSDSLIRTKQYAFAKCSNLEELHITSHFVDAHILKDCSHLQRLTLAYFDSSIDLGYYFDEYNSSVPDSLNEITILSSTQIKDYAFRNLKELSKLTLPNTLIKVGYGIVDGCDKILYNEKENGCYLGNDENPYLILMSMKDKQAASFIIDEHTRFVAGSAFYQAVNLKEVDIPDSVLEIGKSAFKSATSLKSIQIPNKVTELYEDTFADCTSLEEIIIPETVLKVDNTSFTSTAIKRATIPYHCLTALKNTSVLEELYLLNGDGAVNLGLYPKLQKVNLPLGITSIGDDVVDKCPDLIYYEDDYCKYLGNEEVPYIWLMQVKDKAISDCQIQDTTRYIYAQAFMDCTELERVSIPYSILSIGKEAFKNNTKLWVINFPTAASKLDSIEDNAFEGCTALEVIALPDSLSTIGSSVFKNCSSLRKLTLPFVGQTKNPSKASNKTLFGYIFGNGAGTAVSQSYVTNPKSYQMIEYRIPDTLKEVIIQGGTLLSGAFMNCSMITSITLSDRVDFEIGYLYTSPNVISQFYHCQFQKVTMPSKFIPLMMKDSRSGLSETMQSLTITSGETIDAYACERMINLSELVLADSIKTIQHGAFSNCNLKSVKLPNQLETIEAMAFYLNSSLKSIILPRTVKSIGNSAFEECTGLESIYLPQNIDKIGSRAFYNVTATFYLEGSTIPTSWDLSASRPIHYNIKNIVEIDQVVYALCENDALFVGYAIEDSTGIEIPQTIVYEDVTYSVIS